jgi:hypothetical protein
LLLLLTITHRVSKSLAQVGQGCTGSLLENFSKSTHLPEKQQRTRDVGWKPSVREVKQSFHVPFTLHSTKFEVVFTHETYLRLHT